MAPTAQNAADAQKEFAFTRRDFERIRRLIYERAGIALAAGKQEMVYSRLARRLRAVGVDSFVGYLDALESDTGHTEWEAFTNALTTNLTAFFREEHHFPLLAEHVRRREAVQVWCCAASTGEEAYSIAMTLCEAYGSLTPPAHILASDIDTNVLATAEAGIYPIERVERLSPERQKRFFLKGQGAQHGLARVRPELRRMVTFKRINLMDASWPLSEPFDAVFCRNVMIYFDKPTQTRILARFAPIIKPDGLLFAGHSENFMYVTDAFSLRAKTVYQLASFRGDAP
ncbi:CheR family methyltransferase [Noviherbaspirillum pedocola]|uniref:Chemotaxis protein methyltransferase n=1 Tax=Noviherbaspirillum pedocola TaxID=2801341 RepID=A0A934SV33_9BURK|nr:CheR family methyltransferase [Noviherbaspirillum pedocola]MBK4736129.1 chemotaxis protein CheR [Noviherbaspirillum pedocola]